MAQKVKILSVNGRFANTADGRNLRIIGNVRPGTFGYTDGNVIYGNAVPGIYRPPVIPNKTFPLLLDNLGYALEYYFDYPEYVPNSAMYYDPRCPSHLWWNKKFYSRNSTVNYNQWDAITLKDENDDTVLNIQNEFIVDFMDNVFSLQMGDFTYRQDKSPYFEYYTDSVSTTTEYFDKFPADMELPVSGNLNNLSVKIGNDTYDLATPLNALFDSLKNGMQASAGPSSHIIGWGLYKNGDYGYSEDDTINVPNFDYDKDYGAKRFLKISDEEVVIYLDMIGVTYPLNSTYAPAGSPGWWPLFYWFRRIVKINVNGTYSVLYSKDEARWFQEWTAWANMPLYSQNESQTTPYLKDLDGGYYWNSVTKLIYKDNEAVDNIRYDEVKRIYKNNVLAKKEADGYWYLNGNIVIASGTPLTDFFPDYINMFGVMPKIGKTQIPN